MKNPGFSAFLPGWEYIPDIELYVFGDRLYLYGSHDRFGGRRFCGKGAIDFLDFTLI